MNNKEEEIKGRDFSKGWKDKAKERRLEIKRLKKQLKEMGKSRAKWEKKAKKFKERYEWIYNLLKKKMK